MDGHAQKQGSTVGCGTCARVPISWERPQGQGESWFRTIFPLLREGRLLHPYHCPDLLPRSCSNLPLYAQSQRACILRPRRAYQKTGVALSKLHGPRGYSSAVGNATSATLADMGTAPQTSGHRPADCKPGIATLSYHS